MTEHINISSISVFSVNATDYEWEQIKKRLRMYGYDSSGSKSSDKAKLHELELREAKKESTISSKFLTVSKNEQEKIQEKKKERKIENNPQAYPDSQKGAKILGEQIFLAIKMKKDVEAKIKEKKKKEKLI